MNQVKFLSILIIFISITVLTVTFYCNNKNDVYRATSYTIARQNADTTIITVNNKKEKHGEKRRLLSVEGNSRDTITWVKVISSAGLDFQGW